MLGLSSIIDSFLILFDTMLSIFFNIIQGTEALAPEGSSLMWGRVIDPGFPG